MAVIRKMQQVYNNRIFYFAIASTIGMFLYAQFILGYYSSCFYVPDATNSLGLTFGYDIKIVQQFFEIRSSEQLNCYGHFIRVWDSIFPVVYTLMYSLWFVYLFKKWQFLVIIPILHMFSDWIENFIELLLLDSYLNSNPFSEQIVSLGSNVTILKWGFSILTYSIIIFGIIIKLKNFRSSPKQQLNDDN